MKSTDTVQRYTKTAMILHWVVAVAIAINVVLVWCVNLFGKGWRQPLIDTHKSIGITILGLVILRLLWRFSNKPPAFPKVYSAGERLVAHVAHIAFYGVLIALPLSGWVRDSAWKMAAQNPMKLYFSIPWPRFEFIMNMDPEVKAMIHPVAGQVHHWLAYVLYALFLLHVCAALKHQWIDRHPELERMLPERRASAGR